MKIEKFKRRPSTPFVIAASLVLTTVGSVSVSGTSSASSARATVAGYKAPAANACQGKTLGEADISTTISFQAALVKAMEAEGKRLGMKVNVLGANLDNTTEVNNIDDLIAQKVNFIDVTSASATAVIPAVRQAWAAKIPVIAVNAALSPLAKVVTYDGDSDFQYGQAEGKLILQALPRGGKIAIIEGPLGDTATTNRLAGIRSVIGSHKDIKVVDTEVDNFDNSQALADTQDVLAKYPKGTLQAIVAEGPEIFVGANYAKAQGRNDIKFIGGDYPLQVEASIKSGAMYGTVDQSPGLEGTLGVDYACDYLLGKANLIPTPTALVQLPVITKANLKTYPALWND